MTGNIKKYLDGIGTSLPLEIISQETKAKIDQLAVLFSDFAASEYIMETSLNTEIAEVDFSFRVLKEEKDCFANGIKASHFSRLADDENWMRMIGFMPYWSPAIDDIWLEMDYGEYDQQIPQPCFFFNASQLKNGLVVDYDLLFAALEPLLDKEQLEAVSKNIKSVMRQLPAEVGLFQVGVMLARSRDRVRIFTAELSREQTRECLSRIGWPGSFSRLNDIFDLVDRYSDGLYIMDFDVSNQGVSEKIGINFGLDNKKMLPAFLDNLAAHQLCTDAKKTGVMNWAGSQSSFLGPDYGFTALIKDISHFKVSILPEEDLKVKAYLRYAGIYLKELFAAKNSKPIQTMENEVKMEPTGYRGIQNGFKKIAQKSMLDQDYRELCLKDSQAAIQTVIGNAATIPDNIIFLEEEPEIIASDRLVYILPPFLKPSWLTSK